MVLPLDRLEFELPLSPTQMDAVILCAALEFDPAYEILYAFVLNDISRRFPCPELFCGLTDEIRDRFDRRLELGRFGRLRLLGVIVAQGTSPSELRQELRLAPDSSTSCSTTAATPRTSVATAMKSSSPTSSTSHRTSTATGSIGSAAPEGQRGGDRRSRGPRQAGLEDVAMAIARAADRPLWKMGRSRSTVVRPGPTAVAARRDPGRFGAGRDPLDPDRCPDRPAALPRMRSIGEALADLLAVSRIRTILTGAHPWQPQRLLAARPFITFEVDTPDSSQRRAIWQQAAPGTSPRILDELAARFSVSGIERAGRWPGRDDAEDQPCQVGGTACGFPEALAG